MIVEPFCFAQDSFLDKSETLGYGSALQISGGAMHHHTIAILATEGIVGQARSGSGDDAAALMSCVDPVTDLGSPIEGIDVMLPDDAGQSPVADYSERKPIGIVGLFGRAANKSCRIDNICAVVQPGKPFPQVLAVSIDQESKFFGVVLRYLTQLDEVIDQ
jgi:hypothetical protein